LAVIDRMRFLRREFAVRHGARRTYVHAMPANDAAFHTYQPDRLSGPFLREYIRRAYPYAFPAFDATLLVYV